MISSGTTPLAVSQSFSNVTGAVNQGFLEDINYFSFFLGGLGSLSSLGNEAEIEIRFEFLQLHTFDLLIHALFTAHNLLPNSFAIHPFISSIFLTMARYELERHSAILLAFLSKANATPEFLNFEILIPYFKPVNAPYACTFVL